jgi:hypothetical protein
VRNLAISAVLAWSALTAAPALGQARVNIPQTTLVPSTAPSVGGVAPAGTTLGTPTFDPYAINQGVAAPPSPFGAPPAYGAPPTYGVPNYGTAPTFPAAPTNPYGAPPAYGQPPLNSQPFNPFGNPYGQQFSQPPPVQYPGGTWSDDIGRADPYQAGDPLRLFQNIRLRHTWISRMENEQGLGINDSEIATTAAFPRFLFTQQPLYVSPGFMLHLWDGPNGPPADLPSKAYSAYVDFDYVSNPQLRLGADLHVRLGVFSDFNTLTTNSFRISGRGLGTYRLTPTVQAKFGVEYWNRNDIKLMPAGGILWTPNPQVRFDIYFPKPKLAMYVTTLGNTEVWGYLAAEYGGGYWTIERDSGVSDRIDINDYRAILGFDFNTGPNIKAFFEAGYVFEREVVYVVSPLDSFSPDSSFMLRGGIAY